MSFSLFILWLNFLLLVPWHECAHAKWVSIDLIVTPEQPAIGENVTLTCDYDIGNQQFHGLKFYKGSVEIFKYWPMNTDEPPNVLLSSYYLPENLLILGAAQNVIQFQPVSKKASGTYSCEVFFGEPDLTSIKRPKNITVLPAIEVVGRTETNYKSIELKVEPEQPSVGETTNMTCIYNIGTDSLYALRFYKGYEEIFRYVPTDNPSEYFPTNYLPSLPDLQHVTGLEHNVIKFQPEDVSTSGMYSCEVMCGQPSFETLKFRKNITVLPAKGVVEKTESQSKSVELTIEPKLPSVGETVNMTCNYDIGDNALHALVITKGSEDMLRYMPVHQKPPKRVYHASDLQIIATENNVVQFQPLTVNASGTYYCSVLLSKPSFKITTDSLDLTVQPAKGSQEY